jgi:hypothetical protein
MAVKSDIARLVDLPEDHLLLLPMDGAPGADPPLQGPSDSHPEIGMSSQRLLEDGDGSQTGSRFQHRHNLRRKDIGQRVRSPPFPPRLLL